MAIKSDIKDISVVDFLQLMRYGLRTGILEIYMVSGEVHKIYVKGGLIAFATSSRKYNLLGDIIVNNGLMKEEEKDHHLNEFNKHHKDEMRFGQYLILNNIIEEEIIIEIVEKQIRSLLSDILSLKEGTFSFEAGVSVPEVEDIQVSIDINDIIFESLEQSREWDAIRRFVKGDDEVFIFPPENYIIINSGKVKLSWLEWNILNLLNGKNTVGDISKRIGASIFEVSKVLKDFIEKKLIRNIKIKRGEDIIPAKEYESVEVRKEIKTEKHKSVIGRILTKIKNL